MAIPSLKWDLFCSCSEAKAEPELSDKQGGRRVRAVRKTLLDSSCVQSTAAWDLEYAVILTDYTTPLVEKSSKQQTKQTNKQKMLACPETFPHKKDAYKTCKSRTPPLVAPVKIKIIVIIKTQNFGVEMSTMDWLVLTFWGGRWQTLWFEKAQINFATSFLCLLSSLGLTSRRGGKNVKEESGAGGGEVSQSLHACVSAHADNLPVLHIQSTFRTPQKQSLLSPWRI